MTKIDAMLNELSISRTLVGDALANRCAFLAGELSDRDERIAGLNQQNMNQAKELDTLKAKKK